MIRARPAPVILVTLDLVDMFLIANLVIMVVISGQQTFISPFRLEDEPSMPNSIVTAGAFVLFNWLKTGPKKTGGGWSRLCKLMPKSCRRGAT